MDWFRKVKAADYYKLLGYHALECVAWGGCGRNCPFGVGIIQKMKKAAEIFGYYTHER